MQLINVVFVLHLKINTAERMWKNNAANDEYVAHKQNNKSS